MRSQSRPFRSTAVRNPDALSRFEQEARSASALNHPNIVTIYELGHENGTRYIAMELVDGETVRSLLASGPIPFRKSVAIAAQIADGLAKAHEIGLIHRDLKPENLMVSRDGTAKVLDFGLAKLLKPDRAAVRNRAPASPSMERWWALSATCRRSKRPARKWIFVLTSFPSGRFFTKWPPELPHSERRRMRKRWQQSFAMNPSASAPKRCRRPLLSFGS